MAEERGRPARSDSSTISPAGDAAGEATRYDTGVDLSDPNLARTQLVLLTPGASNVLEVGPSTGYLTRVLRDRGCRVTGLEIDPVAAEHAARVADRMVVGDVESLDFEEAFGEERFDVVMFGDVLEHLVEPGATLRRAASLLAEGGRVVASIPNLAHGDVRLALLAGRFPYTSQGLLDRTHLRFFTREGIDALFGDGGFRITEWRRVTAALFETELALPRGAFPPRVVEAVRRLPEAETYQFVVAAVPGKVRAAPAAPAAEEVEAAVAPLWEFDREVEWLRGSLEEARGQLQDIRSSTTYRVVSGLRASLRRAGPRGTPRGRVVDSVVRSVRHLVRRLAGPRG